MVEEKPFIFKKQNVAVFVNTDYWCYSVTHDLANVFVCGLLKPTKRQMDETLRNSPHALKTFNVNMLYLSVSILFASNYSFNHCLISVS